MFVKVTVTLTFDPPHHQNLFGSSLNPRERLYQRQKDKLIKQSTPNLSLSLSLLSVRRLMFHLISWSGTPGVWAEASWLEMKTTTMTITIMTMTWWTWILPTSLALLCWGLLTGLDLYLCVISSSQTHLGGVNSVCVCVCLCVSV